MAMQANKGLNHIVDVSVVSGVLWRDAARGKQRSECVMTATRPKLSAGKHH
jgi:hypothetical protein